ncbi:hypothetical protein R80B4_01122 [Fibrobacteres bacterium R8-0-B4]
MFCQKCGKELADDAQFCHQCGTPIGARFNCSRLKQRR